MPSIPTTELKGASIYSLEKNRKRSIGSSSGGSTPRETKKSALAKTLCCRICGQFVKFTLFVAHTELCAVKIELEVKSLECDNYLRKLKYEFSKQAHKIESEETSKLLGKLFDIAQVASLLSFFEESTFQRLLERTEKIISAVKQQENEPLASFETSMQELYEWISFKQVVWENINTAQERLRTLVGGKDDENSGGITTKKPKLTDFEIITLLAKGGYSRVYLAKKLSDYFAIKVLSRNSDKTKFDNVYAERNIMATTSCPFVVRMYYAFATNVRNLLIIFHTIHYLLVYFRIIYV